MEYQYHDGGRANAGFKGETGDCVVRAIALATVTPYIEVYNAFKAKGKSPRDGVHRKDYQKYLEERGWKWEPLMGFGTGTKVHLRDGELPHGRIICRVSRHMVAIIDQVIYDTHDPSRRGTRAVYGFFYKP
jgi:hypothetical protein